MMQTKREAYQKASVELLVIIKIRNIFINISSMNVIFILNYFISLFKILLI